jgi:rhamnosyltransferase
MVAALAGQRLRPDRIMIIDSESTDGSVDRFNNLGAEIVRIPRTEFDHGGTRNLGVRLLGTETVVFLTQDAIPADDRSLEAIITGLVADESVALAYGRQLPHEGAGPLARSHRNFNYPPMSSTRSAADVARLGVRAAFASNSFAAYRTEALDAIGGFPTPVIGSEDRWAAARLLQAGRRIAYVGHACVLHSHDYSLVQQFRRYFDIGVFQASQPWYSEYLGTPQAEGRRLISAQATALRESGVRFVGPRLASSAAASWLGFHAGRLQHRLPVALAQRCTTAPTYFSDRGSGAGGPAPPSK